MKIYKNIGQLIGNTPLVLSQKINTNPNVQLLFKLERQNPGGSVKDRAAYEMLQQALKTGRIDANTKIIEPTAGNTGIALAMMSNLLGLNMTLVMPENSTKERTETMKAYGAKVVLTPAGESMVGARDYAAKKIKQGYVMLNQFANDDNWKAHYKTTGAEIWNDTEGKVTHFVSSMGTTGTIMGVSSYLKEKSNTVEIIGVHPKEGAKIPGIRKWPQSHLPKFYTPKKIDRILEVSQQEATTMTKRLAKEEGILAGMSSGGAVASALKICEEIKKGVVVVIICDIGDRYLSANLFD